MNGQKRRGGGCGLRQCSYYKEVACRKMVKVTNRRHIQNVGKYLDIVKKKWFIKVEYM